MAGKKIQVGVADESLTPDEQHKIEVKLDKMLAMRGAPPVTEVAEKPEPVKVKITDTNESPEVTEPTEAPAPVAAKKQKVTVQDDESIGEKIAVTHEPVGKSPEVVSESEVSDVTNESEASDATPDAVTAATPSTPAVVPQLVRVPWREPVPVAPEPKPEPLPPAESTSAGTSVTIGNLDAIPESKVFADDSDPSDDASDAALAAAAIKKAGQQSANDSNRLPKSASGNIFKRLVTGWWRSRRWRYGTIAAVLLLLLALFAVPSSRAMALNVFGLRATTTVTVLDGTTQLPLEGAQVSLGTVSGTSNASGQVTLHGVRLGKQSLRVEKPAFAVSQTVRSISLGNNALGSIALKADGTLYKFSITEYLTGKAIPTAKAVDGDASAISDKHGIITLTLKAPSASFQAAITAPGYRKELVQVTVGKAAVVPVKMVPATQDVYVSNQDGKYGVYGVDIDGKNSKLLLAGTGNETAQLALVANASGEAAALISTRDDQRDSGGYLLQTLTLINTTTKAATTIDHSQRIQIIDWSGDRLVYVIAKAGASAANPSRYQLLSYNFKTSQRLQLDHANYFNDVVSAGGSIYYATSNQYSGGVSEFKKINADGNDKQTLLADEVWDLFRTAHDKFAISSPAGWYDYQLDAAKPTSTTSAYTGNGLLYQDSPDGKNSVWLDNRDGKSILLLHSNAGGQDSILVSRPNISQPIRWLDKNTLIFRIKSSSETADYAVGISGGSPKKIIDVTNATGIDRYQN